MQTSGLLTKISVCLRVIHVLWSWEWFQRPVQEAVQEDQSGTSSPHHQNGGERYPKVINHLKTELQTAKIKLHFMLLSRQVKTIYMQVCHFVRMY